MQGKGEIVIYQNSDDHIKIDVRLEDETVWLTQTHLCELFQKSKPTISEHIKNIWKVSWKRIQLFGISEQLLKMANHITPNITISMSLFQ